MRRNWLVNWGAWFGCRMWQWEGEGEENQKLRKWMNGKKEADLPFATKHLISWFDSFHPEIEKEKSTVSHKEHNQFKMNNNIHQQGALVPWDFYVCLSGKRLQTVMWLRDARSYTLFRSSTRAKSMNKFVTSQHCLAYFWKKTNIKTSPYLGTQLQLLLALQLAQLGLSSGLKALQLLLFCIFKHVLLQIRKLCRPQPMEGSLFDYQAHSIKNLPQAPIDKLVCNFDKLHPALLSSCSAYPVSYRDLIPRLKWFNTHVLFYSTL